MRPIVIAAGGTGGHFFPAEALAAELVARGQRVALMTDVRAATKLPESFTGREVLVLRGAGIAGRGLRRGMGAAARLLAGTAQARAALHRLQPSAIVGFGGYPTVAPVLATRLMGTKPPVVLHEQNAVLGRANRALARWADVVALSFPSTARVPAGTRTAVTGNPVRQGFEVAEPQPRDGSHILVVGGSLGARVFADTVPAAITGLPPHLRQHLHITQQCRPEDLDRVGAHYAAHGMAVELAPFLDDMPARMGQATLVIARAGASTVAELAAAGVPAILVPLPGAIDDHQTANARVLAECGGAWLVPQAELTVARLTDRLAAALGDDAATQRAARAAHGSAERNAATRLADLVLQHARVSA